MYLSFKNFPLGLIKSDHLKKLEEKHDRKKTICITEDKCDRKDRKPEEKNRKVNTVKRLLNYNCLITTNPYLL